MLVLPSAVAVLLLPLLMVVEEREAPSAPASERGVITKVRGGEEGKEGVQSPRLAVGDSGGDDKIELKARDGSGTGSRQGGGKFSRGGTGVKGIEAGVVSNCPSVVSLLSGF